MKPYRSAVAVLAMAIAVGSWILVGEGQQPPPPPGPLQLAPLGARGEAVWPAFEGWGPVKDGQNVLLLGYYNRNREQEFDIPIGPNNRIEPGGPDYGQPTHFHTGRQYGVFAIPLPKDFGNKKLTWTLIANGQTATISFWMNPPYWIDFFTHAASGNTPPVIKFAPGGPDLTGPPRGVAQTLSGSVGQPVTLKAWASDKPATVADPEARGRGADAARGRGADAGRGRGADAGGRAVDAGARGAGAAPNFDVSAAAGRGAARGRGGRGSGPPADIVVIWKKHRGPGDVKVADEEIRLLNKGVVDAVMEATTTATFSAPGEYWMRAQVNDASGDGGGGDQCCWTTAHVKVTVK